MGTTLKEACYQGTPGSAVCVQRFDDSLNSAIRITYRILLRSSSSLEPRHPLLRIVLDSVFFEIARGDRMFFKFSVYSLEGFKKKKKSGGRSQ